MTTTTEDPAGRWHTVPFHDDIDDPQVSVDDAEEDEGQGLDGVLVDEAPPGERGDDDGA
jgi:hypothetical protein